MADPRRFFPLVDQLRAVAALLVVYGHLVGDFLDALGRSWPPKNLIDLLLRDPLHAELNFAWLGVVLFFFISGFVVTHAAMDESGAAFAIRRILRVYPPLIVVVLIVAMLARFGVLTTGVTRPPTALETVAEGSLAGYALAWGPPFIAVAWTLMIEVLFYAALLAVKPLLRRMPWLAPLLILAVVLALTLLLGRPQTGVLRYLSFLPVLVAGMVIYLLHTGRVRSWAGALLLAGAGVTLVLAQQRTNPELADTGAAYLANVALGGLIFTLVVVLEGRVRPWRALAAVARRSYSIYLVHLSVGGTILSVWVVQAGLPYTPGLLLALLASAVAAELLHRLVERPSMALGKRLSRRTSPAA